MQEAIVHSFDDEPQKDPVRALAVELGFVETDEMADLSRQVQETVEFAEAKELMIRYRILAEEAVSAKQADQLQGQLAGIGVMIGMLALYLDNHRFAELEEFIDDEFNDALIAAEQLIDEQKAIEVAQKIQSL